MDRTGGRPRVAVVGGVRLGTALTDALTPRAGLLVGHCSGATTLEVLAPHEALSLHPLMTVPPDGTDLAGATAAVAGTSDRALALAEQLAGSLGMLPVQVRDEDRAAYHAACPADLELYDVLVTRTRRLADQEAPR